MLLPAAVWAALALTFNALVWGTSWWPFRHLEHAGLHPLWATALIYAVPVLALSVWKPSLWQGFVRTPQLLLLCLGSGLTNLSFNWGVTIGDVVRVVLLFYLMPIWSMLLAWWILGERPTRVSLAQLALSVCGVLLVLWPDQMHPKGIELADALGILGGMSFALNNVMLRKLKATPEAERSLAMFVGGTAMAGGAAWLLMALGQISAPPAVQTTWLAWAAGLAVVFLLGNMALQYGAARLPARITALVMLSEIVFASVSSAALGAADITVRVVFGAVLIVSSGVLAVVFHTSETH
jgi:drug/metabolite transporter (DMT)-like permease